MSDARIHDVGYQHHAGPRTGVPAAVWSVTRHGFRSLLGIRRGVFAKLVTIGTAALAYLPALVFVGLSVLLPAQLLEAADLPGPADYLGFVLPSLLFFTSMSVPVVLCPDRRSGALALYLASPLNRDTYLLGRALAVFSFLLIVTVGPPLLLLIGLWLLGERSLGEFVLEAIRAFAAGGVMSVLFTSVGMAIASFTDRHTAASGFTILFLLGSLVASGILTDVLELSSTVNLANVVFVGIESTLRINAETHGSGILDEVPTVVLAMAALAWTAAGLAVTRWRYGRVQVTR